MNGQPLPRGYQLLSRAEILQHKIALWEARLVAGHPDAERALADLRRKAREGGK